MSARPACTHARTLRSLSASRASRSTSLDHCMTSFSAMRAGFRLVGSIAGRPRPPPRRRCACGSISSGSGSGSRFWPVMLAAADGAADPAEGAGEAAAALRCEATVRAGLEAAPPAGLPRPAVGPWAPPGPLPPGRGAGGRQIGGGGCRVNKALKFQGGLTRQVNAVKMHATKHSRQQGVSDQVVDDHPHRVWPVLLLI